VCGGLHLPVTGSRSTHRGLPIQQLACTGKPPWSPIDGDDLSRTIDALNRAKVGRLLLSAHDSCDHALDRLSREVDADVEVLCAGERYVL